MEDILKLLKERSQEDWLIHYDSKQFYRLTTEFYQQFKQLNSSNKPLQIILAESNPYKFLAAFLASIAANCRIFLCNPDWQQQEWEQVFSLVRPDIIIGQLNNNVKLEACNIPIKTLPANLNYTIMIPTGGSSGHVRFTIHTWKTLKASVQGFQAYFQIKSINSFCVLSLYHVSGLMQFLRSFLTNGQFLVTSYKSVNESKKYNLNLSNYFISLVPTQLQSLLESNSYWLSQFYTVLLGGAPSWSSLLSTAREHNIRLALTYGMTETASQIVTLKPQDFLNDNNSNGQVLPHAKVRVDAQTGTISIDAQSLFLGYYPEIRVNTELITDDVGYFDPSGYLHILGRNSQKIVTGGENVYPIEVESAIVETGLVKDVAVIGVSDSKWGQAIAAIYVPQNQTISQENIKLALVYQIAKFKHPKYWIKLDKLPRSPQGKINYRKLHSIVNKIINNFD